jgi:protoporphyrinogen oxidase
MEHTQINANNRLLSVAVVGGGVAGIAAALKLVESGRFSVTVFEKESEIGGLSSSYMWQDLNCDRFYHVILPTDSHLLEFIRKLGLESGLFWEKTKSGFYGRGRLVSLSSTRDLLRFPFMSFWQKIRLGLGILYANRIRHPRKLDSISARTWLTRLFGARTYEGIWKPLLRSKFGDAHDRVSASLIWATIKRLYGTRSSVEKQESLGHVQGGYMKVFEAVRKKLQISNAKILPGMKIEKVAANRQNGKIVVTSSSKKFEFDKLLLTIPCQQVLRIIEDNKEHPYWRRLDQIEYLGVICSLLVLKRRVSPYYVINLLDGTLPFTGIVESTNLIPSHYFGKRHLVYLPKYVTKDDPLSNLSDQEISSIFFEKLRSVFPDLNEKDLLHEKIFREKYVQPVLDVGFLERQVGFQTPVPGVYLVNSSMISNSTLNNNAIINLAIKAAEKIIEDLT